MAVKRVANCRCQSRKGTSPHRLTSGGLSSSAHISTLTIKVWSMRAYKHSKYCKSECGM